MLSRGGRGGGRPYMGHLTPNERQRWGNFDRVRCPRVEIFDSWFLVVGPI